MYFPLLSPQVNIEIEDVNDNAPEFESGTVRISVPENAELGTPLYAANAHDRDSGDAGVVTYRLQNIDGGEAATIGSSLSATTFTASSQSSATKATALAQSSAAGSATDIFAIDARSGHLTLSRHLDYELSQRHSLVVMATDSGDPPLSANLTILVEVQDINDNAPVFEKSSYAVKVIESMAVNSQVCDVFNYIILFKLCLWMDLTSQM